MTYAEPHRRRLRSWRTVTAFTATAIALVGTAVAITNGAEARSRHNPIGAIESITQVRAGGIRVTGWAVDPDSTRPVKYQVLIDNKVTTSPSLHAASHVRMDIARRTGLGSRHGVALNVHSFRNHARLTAGRHKVCLKVGNIGRKGRNTVVACRMYTINFNPRGAITSATQVPGGVRVSGWTYDRGSPLHKLGVTATVAGRAVTATASHPVSGLSAISGPAHGFIVTIPVAANGKYPICVVAHNVGTGRDVQLPCATKSLNFSPVGAITSLRQAPNGFTVGGWATDPDTSSAVSGNVLVDGVKAGSLRADGHGNAKPGHTFSGTYRYPTAGTHQVCFKAGNAPGTPGRSRKVACQNISLNFNPTAHITSVTQVVGGVHVQGWATDPDTSAAVPVSLSLDMGAATTMTANITNTGSRSGHVFAKSWTVAAEGRHTVCATPVNAKGTAAGPGSPKSACGSVAVNYSPTGAVDQTYTRVADGSATTITGWAVDRNTTNPVSVTVASVDGNPVASGSVTPATANAPHARITVLSGYGTTAHGFSLSVPSTVIDQNEHDVCLQAIGDTVGAQTSPIGCLTVYAANPTVPTAPVVTATSPYAGVATVSWPAATSATDGGGQMLDYTVTVTGTTVKRVVDVPGTSATLSGLTAGATYTVNVVARNTAGSSGAGVRTVKIATAPPPQQSPAPVSTSRYVRNIHDGSATDLAKMKAEGVADAKANPSGHRYLILLQIGGQDQYDNGVVLSAGVRFVTYATVVANMKSYIDGYASAQKPSAPVTIAIGTNNDMDVNATTGAQWANAVVDPVRSYATKYAGQLAVAGANDIEPGFRANYSSSAAWLSGYLHATSAPFIFNGSADGCSWTATSRGCNNGWTMAGLYNLAGGASPTRIVSLPQIYNTTMPKQWKYISLTGVVAGKKRINFGGPLTEYTACSQAGSCGSIAGRTAWSQLWNQLQSDSRLKVSSVPYSTDLRIDS